MRFFSIFPVLIAFACASPEFFHPGEVTRESQEEFYNVIAKNDNSRIANGFAAKNGEFPEFGYLSINFYQKQQNCGCWIFDELHVVTSATCVQDCSEGLASNVTVTFPALSGAAAVKKIAKIFIPTTTNGAAALDAGFTPETDFTKIPLNNVGVIRLDSKLAIDPTKPTVKAAAPKEYTDIGVFNMMKPAKDWRFRICGLGITNNQGLRVKGVMCTEVNLVPSELCNEQYDAEKKFPPGAGQQCLQWTDRDNNACIGDFGGPVYAYKLDPKGAIDVTSQEVFCTVLGSPNVRKAASCLDAHILWCQDLFGPSLPDSKTAIAWIKNVVKEP